MLRLKLAEHTAANLRRDVTPLSPVFTRPFPCFCPPPPCCSSPSSSLAKATRKISSATFRQPSGGSTIPNFGLLVPEDNEREGTGGLEEVLLVEPVGIVAVVFTRGIPPPASAITLGFLFAAAPFPALLPALVPLPSPFPFGIAAPFAFGAPFDAGVAARGGTSTGRGRGGETEEKGVGLEAPASSARVSVGPEDAATAVTSRSRFIFAVGVPPGSVVDPVGGSTEVTMVTIFAAQQHWGVRF